jgi:hypothetical protein
VQEASESPKGNHKQGRIEKSVSVINLSEKRTLTLEEQTALSMGLNFAVVPKQVSNIATAGKEIAQRLPPKNTGGQFVQLLRKQKL